jgi:hypothetical protein
MRSIGAALILGGGLGWAISLVAVGPLIPELPGHSPSSFMERQPARNWLTGHTLVAEATAVEPSFAWITSLDDAVQSGSR